jgi:hypothetical protein
VRGETSNDLLANLFKGYGAAMDKIFVDYISRKKERYEEGGKSHQMPSWNKQTANVQADERVHNLECSI